MISKCFLFHHLARDGIGLKRGRYQTGHLVQTLFIVSSALNPNHLFKEGEHIPMVCF
jgi:hypothetical protein